MGSEHLWDIVQRIVVIPYWRFGTKYRALSSRFRISSTSRWKSEIARI